MSVPCEMLLHPELLSNEQLITVIQERQLRLPNMEMFVRDELLDIFHNYCVPFGQRRYRDTGRGKLLNSSRHILPEVLPKLDIISNCPSRKTAFPTKLKPPPDLLSGHMKRIKLEHPSQANKECNKRKMEVDDVSQVTDGPPLHKKERKPITWP